MYLSIISVHSNSANDIFISTVSHPHALIAFSLYYCSSMILKLKNDASNSCSNGVLIITYNAFQPREITPINHLEENT